MRVAIYTRVSTGMQTVENQRGELLEYVRARGWTLHAEYTDVMSGAKDVRPGLTELLNAAKRRKFDVVLCWRLDRIGRNLRHLVILLEDLSAIGVGFISLNEGIDLGTPAGRLQLHILAALGEFERSRIQERVRAGLARAKAQGKRLGRPRRDVPPDQLASIANVQDAALALGVSRSTVRRRLREGRRRSTPPA